LPGTSDEVDIKTGAVGITEPRYADEIIASGDATGFHCSRDAARTVLDAKRATGIGRRACFADSIRLRPQAPGEVSCHATLMNSAVLGHAVADASGINPVDVLDWLYKKD
jgi:hypothetical protein